MLVRATRTLSTWVLRALFYAALFFTVVLAQLALTGALRQHGWNGGAALFASGGGVLALVLVLVNVADWLRQRLRDHREMQRVRLKLPQGSTSIVWRNPEAEAAAAAIPWHVIGPMRARYPRLPRLLGIEGYAIAEFEVSAEGRAKNIHVVESWPSDLFYESAREALMHARFQPSGDEHVRFGATYRMPFVFRLAGVSKVGNTGARARTLRPIIHGAQRLVENARERGAQQR